MTVKLNDAYLLATAVGFQNQVQAALSQICVQVSSENPTTTPFHQQRKQLAAQILQGLLGTTPNWVVLFANAIAALPNATGTPINDATANGATNLTAGNLATQAALVTDTDVLNGISSVFNAFVFGI